MKTDQIYIYRCGNEKTPLGRSRMQWKGKKCRVLAWGGMNSCLVEFIDNGELLNCSRNALRKGQINGTKCAVTTETDD